MVALSFFCIFWRLSETYRKKELVFFSSHNLWTVNSQRTLKPSVWQQLHVKREKSLGPNSSYFWKSDNGTGGGCYPFQTSVGICACAKGNKKSFPGKFYYLLCTLCKGWWLKKSVFIYGTFPKKRSKRNCHKLMKISPLPTNSSPYRCAAALAMFCVEYLNITQWWRYNFFCQRGRKKAFCTSAAF